MFTQYFGQKTTKTQQKPSYKLKYQRDKSGQDICKKTKQQLRNLCKQIWDNFFQGFRAHTYQALVTSSEITSHMDNNFTVGGVMGI